MPHVAPRNLLRRAGVLLQAALLALGLSVAPDVHSRFCNDACASHASTSGAETSCHSGADDAGGGCACIADCCSIVACGVVPDVLTDAALPTPVTTSAPGPDLEAPRSPDAWLLPYPTGPPPAA